MAADNPQLDSFLASGAQEATGEPTPPQPSEATPAAATDGGGAKEPPASKVTTEPSEPEEDVAPHTGSDNRTVPFSALEKVRNDWKSKYAAEQARAELLTKQLEEAKKPPPPQPVYQQQPQQPLPPIDIIGNPQGFVERVQQVFAHERTQLEQKMLNDRLNMSELMLRKEIGPDKVESYVADFQQFAQRDPSLWGKLYAQANPYGWLQTEIDRQRAHHEIGDDPAAYEAKLRAKWEAEQQQPPAPVSPAAGLPPSLANARSVAGRTTSTFTGPVPMEELFPGHNRRAATRR